MATYLRIQDGIAVEEWSEPEGFTIDQCFAEGLVETFQPKGSAEVGWIWDGKDFSAPASRKFTSNDLASYAAGKRFAVETGGISVGGSSIATDRSSQAMITGAWSYIQASGATSVRFKAASGFVTLDADTLKSIALAVGVHVQACFAAEEVVVAAIDAGTITTPDEIDAASWPATS